MKQVAAGRREQVLDNWWNEQRPLVGMSSPAACRRSALRTEPVGQSAASGAR